MGIVKCQFPRRSTQTNGRVLNRGCGVRNKAKESQGRERSTDGD